MNPESTSHGLSHTLLVRQSERNHREIAAFLKRLHQHTVGGQPLMIQIWWLPLDIGAQQELNEMLKGGNAVSALNTLTDSVNGYHGQLKTRDRVTGNLSSGYQMPLVVGKISVVGTGAVGEQPIVSHVHIGIMAEVTPRVLATWEGEGAQLTMQTETTTMNNLIETTDAAADVDRFQLGRDSLESNVICSWNQPVVVGSLSTVGLSSDQAENNRELTLVVLITK